MSGRPNAASVALVRDGRVLVVKRDREPFRGLWTLPGGRLEPGESAEECAMREVREELGVKALALQSVMGVEVGAAGWVLQVFATDQFEGEPRPGEELAGLVWTDLERLRQLQTTPGLARVLARVFTQPGGWLPRK